MPGVSISSAPPGRTISCRVAGERRHDEQHLHVRSDHLLVDGVPGSLVGDGALPPQASLDERTIRRSGRGHQDPVSDHRQIRGGQPFVPQSPADLGEPLELAVDRVEPALLLDDARHEQVTARADVGLILEEGRPSTQRGRGQDVQCI